MSRSTGWSRCGVLLLLLVAQLFVVAARIQRAPAPPWTFHQYSLSVERTAMLLRGDGVVPDLPVDEVLPVSQGGMDAGDLLRATLRQPERYRLSYRNPGPIWLLVEALPATVFGLSVLGVRLGAFFMLALLALVVGDTGRRIGGAGLTSAAVLLFWPVGYESAWQAGPFVGNMLAAALVIWALVASDAFRRPLYSLLLGLFLGLAPRWGESAGDGLRVLGALAGPLGVGVLVVLWRLVARRDWRGLVGLALAAAVAAPLGEWGWVRAQGLSQIAEQAGLGHAYGVSGLRRAWWMLGRHVWNYPDALYASLQGPVGALVSWIGVPLALWRGRPRWSVWALLGAVVGLSVMLSVSLKGQDYYLAPAMPALALLAGVGLTALPRWGRWPVMAWLGATWLIVSHLDLPAVAARFCSPTANLALTQGTYACGPAAPRTRLYPWFRDWRQPQRAVRARLGRWMVSPRADQVFAQVPAGGVVMVVETPGSEDDVLALILQARRPDLLVVPTIPERPSRGLDTLLRGRARAWALTTIDGRKPGARPAAAPPWLGSTDPVLHDVDVALYEVRYP